MQLIKALFVALVAGSTAALDGDTFIHPENRRALGLEPRQTFGGGGLPDLPASCTSALLGLAGSLPTPAPRLASAIIGGGRNPCSVTVPASLSSSYSSYNSEVKSWYSESSDDVSSAFSQCTALSSVVSRLPICASSILAGAFGGGGSSGTETGTETGSSASETTSGGSQTTGTGTSSSSTGSSASETTGTGATEGGGGSTGTTTAGAARETGMAMAALAAGFAAAML